jgi:hypothetical protein
MIKDEPSQATIDTTSIVQLRGIGSKERQASFPPSGYIASNYIDPNP